MAMATSICCTTALSNKTISKQKENYLSPRTCVSTCSKFQSLQLTAKPSRVVVSAAATSAVEVEPRTTAATPSKALPFRVGHGFDLHRLEPGYPLIIGGIDIPHDRGCEAHSDGKKSYY